jgi:hypothetical protein
MTETLANVGPILMCIGTGWLIFCLWSIVIVGMIFDDDMEREDMERNRNDQ